MTQTKNAGIAVTLKLYWEMSYSSWHGHQLSGLWYLWSSSGQIYFNHATMRSCQILFQASVALSFDNNGVTKLPTKKQSSLHMAIIVQKFNAIFVQLTHYRACAR